MTLQSSGAISLSQVNTELGFSSTATISLGDTAVRNLAGVSTGAIAMSSLYGKTGGVTFSPVGSTNAGAPQSIGAAEDGSAEVFITASGDVTWNWTRSGATAGTGTVFNASGGAVGIASGLSGRSVRFRVTATTTSRTSTFSVNVTANGVTRYWTVTVTAYGTGSVMTL